MLALCAGIFLVSAAMLFFEIGLTRLFSVSQWYHFAFMSVSVALLGLGASGTWLAVHPPRFAPGPAGADEPLGDRDGAVRHQLALLAALFSAGVLVAYLAINYVPFDSYRVALERRQLLYLPLYYAALIVPFFFAGLCIGLCLAVWPAQASALYAANLTGSAVGSLVVLVLVPLLGGAPAVLSASVLGMLGAIALSLAGRARRATRLIYAALFLALLALLVSPPAQFALRVSPYKTLSSSLLFPQARLVFSRWNAFSRVDVVDSGGIHSAPGLSLASTGQLPKQLGLMVDGGNLSSITCLRRAGDEQFLKYLPSALPYLLRPGADALVIEPRGGLDLLAALHGGASSVLALEANPLLVFAVRAQASECAPSVYDEPRVQLVVEEPRSYLRRSAAEFDVVQLPLGETYQPVISGAYSLSESYAYTVEAFVDYLRHLREDGILVVSRWLQSPPSEDLRACVLTAEALSRSGVGDPLQRVVAFRTWSTVTVLAKVTPFRDEEIALLRTFCAERSFDLIYYDGLQAAETNRYNVLTDTAHHDTFRRALSSGERTDLVRGYPYDISPPVDDRPFFFHFFRWGQARSILRALGRTWQPFGGSGFLILIALLLLAILLSAVLILLPLWLTAWPGLRWKKANRSGDDTALCSERHARSCGGNQHKVGDRQELQAHTEDAAGRQLGERGKIIDRGRLLLLSYFACLGLGFLFVEMPLLQQFILFLGQPAYSFSLVLFSVLLFSGLGSLLSVKMPLRWALALLVMLVLAYPVLLPRLFDLAMGWGLPWRLATAVFGLAPLGLLLGQPMPGGIRLLERRARQWIPWAWGVNGCVSVVSSILAVMGAVTFGFSRVLLGGALAYGLAWIILLRLPPYPVEKGAA